MAIFKKTNKKLDVKKENSLMTFFKKKKEADLTYDNVAEGMYKYYKELLYPLEEAYLFHDLIAPKLTESDFKAKPMVLFIGEYSTGKTTFINNLINLPKGYPQCRIGDEPTTDEFVILMKGNRTESVEISGQALIDDVTKRYTELKKFGSDFAKSFRCCEMSTDLALFDHVTIVDTPGVLSGAKQKSRKYDFREIIRFFCERADIIILLFDSKRMDIGEEFRKILKIMQPFSPKIKYCLNKVDQFPSTKVFLRVFGSFMWSFGQFMKTPEAPTIYITSLSKSSESEDLQKIIDKDNNRIKEELQKIKAGATMHKLDLLVSRINKANVHAKIIARLKSAGPKKIFEKKYDENRTAKILEEVFQELEANYLLAKCDFPNAEEFRDAIVKHNHQDFKQFKDLKSKFLEPVEKLLKEHLPQLREKIEEEMKANEGDVLITGGVFDNFNEAKANKKKGLEKTARLSHPNAWPVSHKSNVNYGKYKAIFKNIKEKKKAVTFAKAAEPLSLGTPLTKDNIKEIMTLSDCDQDGKLNQDEFTLAGFIVDFYTKKAKKSTKVIVIAKELPEFLKPKEGGGGGGGEEEEGEGDAVDEEAEPEEEED